MRICEIVFVAGLLYTKANAYADSSEEQTAFGINQVFVPSTVNFNEIFSNSLSMLNDDTLTTVIRDDSTKDDFTRDASTKDDSQLTNMPSQLVEFKIPSTTTSTTTTTTPRPRFLTASYLREQPPTPPYSSTSSTRTTTSEPDEPEISKKVLPIRGDHQRGVLDLIMPAARVRNIKIVFDNFRKILSYTFRK